MNEKRSWRTTSHDNHTVQLPLFSNDDNNNNNESNQKSAAESVRNPEDGGTEKLALCEDAYSAFV
jgi:hypothetical protein